MTLNFGAIVLTGAAGNGDGTGRSTKQFLRGLIGALPPIHELAEQAGIDLAEVHGRVRSEPGIPDALPRRDARPELI